MFADSLFERIEVFHSNGLRKLVVDSHRFGRLDRFDNHRELGLLACDLLSPIFLRERYFYATAISGLCADQLLFKSRYETPASKRKIEIFGFTAFEFLAVYFSDKINGHRVARFSDRVLTFVRKCFLRLGDARERFIDILVRHIGNKALRFKF